MPHCFWMCWIKHADIWFFVCSNQADCVYLLLWFRRRSHHFNSKRFLYRTVLYSVHFMHTCLFIIIESELCTSGLIIGTYLFWYLVQQHRLLYYIESIYPIYANYIFAIIKQIYHHQFLVALPKLRCSYMRKYFVYMSLFVFLVIIRTRLTYKNARCFFFSLFHIGPQIIFCLLVMSVGFHPLSFSSTFLVLWGRLAKLH